MCAAPLGSGVCGFCRQLACQRAEADAADVEKLRAAGLNPHEVHRHCHDVALAAARAAALDAGRKVRHAALNTQLEREAAERCRREAAAAAEAQV